MFRWVGEVHPRFRTPHRAIVLQAIWASVLVSSGTYRQLFTRVIFTEWIFFAMMAGRDLHAATPSQTTRPAIASGASRGCRRCSSSRR